MLGIVGLVQLGGDDVELILGASPREGHVAPLPVDRLVTQYEGAVGGHSLGLVASDGVPVGQVTGLEILR